jgi:hypothetical protein
MGRRFICPACEDPLEVVPGIDPGDRIQCPRCGDVITVPGRGTRPARLARIQHGSGWGWAVLWATLIVLGVAAVIGVIWLWNSLDKMASGLGRGHGFTLPPLPLEW